MAGMLGRRLIVAAAKRIPEEHLVATPDIGTTISDGYSRGLDRIGPWFAPLAVVAGLSAVISAVIAQVQIELVPDAEEIFRAILSGDSDLSGGDLATLNLLSALGTAISLAISFAASALFAGILHRERHGSGTDEAPAPGAVIPGLLEMAGRLMPRLGILIGLLVAGQLVGIIQPTLGSIVSLVSFIVFLMLAIRWIYAPVIAGSGEATGDAAFDRSAGTVEGSWWGTFGVFLVIGLATVLPMAIIAAIVGAILPAGFVATLASTFVMTVLVTMIGAATLESAWSQVEEQAGNGGEQGLPAPEQARPLDPPAGDPFS